MPVTNWLVIAGSMLSPVIQNIPPTRNPLPWVSRRAEFTLLPYSVLKLAFNTFVSTDYTIISGSLKKAWQIYKSTRKKNILPSFYDKYIFFFPFFYIRDLIAHTVMLLLYTQYCIFHVSLPYIFYKRSFRTACHFIGWMCHTLFNHTLVRCLEYFPPLTFVFSVRSELCSALFAHPWYFFQG